MLGCFFMVRSYYHAECYVVFFYKQKTAYEMRISDWSSDVCSSDLVFGAADGGDALGAYDPETRTVYIGDHFPPDSLQAKSVLLHELVHHAQTMAGREYPCFAAGEKPAYTLQDTWLKERGGSLKATLNIAPLFVDLVKTCGGPEK